MSFHTGAMKAIARAPRPLPKILAPLVATLALAACVPPPRAEAPPPRHHTPPPPQRAAPLPPPAPVSDWRDTPLTPGTWQWSTTALGSTATFASGQLTIRCNRAAGTVSLIRASTAPAVGAHASIAVTTTQTARTLSAVQGVGTIETSMPARDPLLDAMAFSRGRFMLAATGTPILYVPSWAEVSRVIEDCR